MTFKIGDKVILIKNPNYTRDIWKGREGTISDLYSYDQEFAGRLNFDNGDTIMFNFGDIELVKPPFTPGDRVRGYVEGILSESGEYVLNDETTLCVRLDLMTDVTVIKTLPTAPGSIIEWNDELWGKRSTGGWRGIDNGLSYTSDVFDDNWTLKYDAGA
jgi:hypothetical protein